MRIQRPIEASKRSPEIICRLSFHGLPRTGTTLLVKARAVLKGKPQYRQSTRRAKDTQPRIKRIALTEPPT
jgi:hypothetical protein